MVRRSAAVSAVAAVLLAGVASATPAGRYSGTTTQRQTISLTVNHHTITEVELGATYNFCTGGGVPGGGSAPVRVAKTTFKSHIAIDKRGNFDAKAHPDSATVVRLSGHFKVKTMTGSFTSTLMEGGSRGKRTCSSGKVNFTGRHEYVKPAP